MTSKCLFFRVMVGEVGFATIRGFGLRKLGGLWNAATRSRVEATATRIISSATGLGPWQARGGGLVEVARPIPPGCTILGHHHAWLHIS